MVAAAVAHNSALFITVPLIKGIPRRPWAGAEVTTRSPRILIPGYTFFFGLAIRTGTLSPSSSAFSAREGPFGNNVSCLQSMDWAFRALNDLQRFPQPISIRQHSRPRGESDLKRNSRVTEETSVDRFPWGKGACPDAKSETMSIFPALACPAPGPVDCGIQGGEEGRTILRREGLWTGRDLAK